MLSRAARGQQGVSGGVRLALLRYSLSDVVANLNGGTDSTVLRAFLQILGYRRSICAAASA